MPVRTSSAKSIDSLVADLAGADAVRRDAAAARLTILGARAVDRLIALARSDAPASGRTAALRTLEAIADRRALDVALEASGDRDAAVAVAAIDVARTFVRERDGAAVIDRLSAIALDRGRPEAVRVGAIRALRDLDAKTIAPLVNTLGKDPDAAVRDAAIGQRRKPPDRALDLARAPLPELLALVEGLREREATAAGQRRRELAADRAKVHLALAKRGSRIALYDLRESLERSAEPLPVDALAALSALGDASCLEAIAVAHTRSADSWWRDHLLSVFQTIAKRERLSGRSAVMRKIAKRWPTFRAALG